jgi:hypothetical protein
MKLAMKKIFPTQEGDYNGKFHMAIKKQIIVR